MPMSSHAHIIPIVIKDLHDQGILHQDISTGNIILVEGEDSPVRRGYLIDFEYAVEQAHPDTWGRIVRLHQATWN